MVLRKTAAGGCFMVALYIGSMGAGSFISSAAQAEVDFSGQRIVWIVPSREGGGSDNFSRAFAKFFQKHLPGNPKIVIRNIPGSGQVPGTNHFAQYAKKDGLMMITSGTPAIMNQILGHKAVKYDIGKFEAVLTAPQGTFVYAHPATGVKKQSDIKKLVKSGKAYRFGGNSPASAELRLLVSWDLLGIKIKPLWGISRGKTRQAFMRGETDVNYDTASSWLRKVMPMVKKNEAVPLFTFGVQNDNDEFIRDPQAPGIPHFVEAYRNIHGKKPSGDAFDTWEILFNIGVMTSKGINLQTGTPKVIVNAYVDAAKKILKDPKFAKVKKKRIGAYEVSFGKVAQKRLANAVKVKPETRKWLKTFLKTDYNVDLDG